MSTGAGPFARRHHTVPQFYLRGFARDDQIATLRLPGKHRFLQSVKDASVVKDYYLLEGHDAGADVLEKALSEIEGAAAAVLKSIGEGVWPLEPEQREVLGYFIALQGVRVPVHRRTSDELLAQMIRLEVGVTGKVGLRRRLEAGGMTLTDERLDEIWQEATRPEGPPVRYAPGASMQRMFEMAEHLFPYVLGRPWRLVRFEKRSLVSSDAPVALIRNSDDPAWSGVGYATALAIAFPLTRKLGLLMRSPAPTIEHGASVEDVRRGVHDDWQEGNTTSSKVFNEHTARQASEWVFHHPDDERFVPDDLPEPRPVNMQFSGKQWEFDGEPWFVPRR